MGQTTEILRRPPIGSYLYRHQKRHPDRLRRPAMSIQMKSFVQGEKDPCHIPDSGDTLAPVLPPLQGGQPGDSPAHPLPSFPRSSDSSPRRSARLHVAAPTVLAACPSTFAVAALPGSLSRQSSLLDAIPATLAIPHTSPPPLAEMMPSRPRPSSVPLSSPTPPFPLHDSTPFPIPQ